MTHLALVFPGQGYLHHHAVLDLVHQALAQAGAVVVPITYDDTGDDARFLAGVRRDTTAALAEHRPDRLTLVGKSLGTFALAELQRAVAVPDRTEAIWLTPIWKSDANLEAARAAPWRSLYVVGSADTTYVAERQALLDGETLLVDGMDHGFEIAGDVLATVAAWQRVAAAVLAFASAG